MRRAGRIDLRTSLERGVSSTERRGDRSHARCYYDNALQEI